MFSLTPYAFRRNLTNFDPFREFDEFFSTPAFAESVHPFKTDISHKDGVYTLEADLPGVKKEDISVEIKDEVLTIKAERHSEKSEEDKKDNYIRSERSWGSYERSFSVSEIETDEITCAYEDGVLTLTLPEKKVVEPEVKKLTIA